MAEAALSKPEGISLKNLRAGGLFIAIIIYALWSSPTPEQFGTAEIIIGLLLISAAGISGAFRALDMRSGAKWETGAKLLLIYGLTLPVLTGLIMGNSIIGIIRDLIPFLFLLLPLFLCPLFSEQNEQRKNLTIFIVALGLIFSLRVLLPAVTGLKIVNDPFLLANAPTVLFSALLLIGLCGWYLYRADLLKSAVFIALSLIPLATMALIMQRASVGIFGMTIFFLMIVGLVHRPARVFLPLLLLTLAAFIYWPEITNVTQSLMRKTSLVGFNMRWQEAMAVLDALSGSFFTVLLGKGWGASVASPAVGGAVVNFTHSLITTYWLKTGLVGVCFVLFYLYQLGLLLLQILFRNPVMALALAGPFVIDIFLYASFKSLDFGLVLLLIPLWAEGAERLQKTPGYSIQE